MCPTEIPKWLVNTCWFKCESKKKAEKAKAKKVRDKERKAVSVSVLTKKADKLWSELVKHQWDNVCAYCSKTTYLNSHHLFTRSRRATRWRSKNWICLCSWCHTLSSTFSAHQTSLEFYQWLEEKFWRDWIEERSKKSQEICKVTSWLLQEIIEELTNELNEYKQKDA